MRRSRTSWLAIVGMSLCAAAALPVCGPQENKPPEVDLTGSWVMDSTLGTTTCSNAFVVILTNAGYTFAGKVNLTMIQESADLKISAPRVIMNGIVAGKDFSASSEQIPVTAGACGITLVASIGASASTDAKTFIGTSRYSVQTNGAPDCLLEVTSCTIDWSSSGTKS